MNFLQVIPVEDVELHAEVGSGGNGRVYKGRWNGEGNGIAVAVKEVRSNNPI